MATLIESESVPLSLEDVAKISQTLAEHMQKLVFRTEGFSVADYFSLDGNYLVEYVEGRLQILPLPDSLHQALVEWFTRYLFSLFAAIDPAARSRTSPFKVMLDAVRYREPDVCVMVGKHAHRRRRDYWEGCDLAIEIISASNAAHDWKTKRTDYAAAGIPEYWVIDPVARTLTQFLLEAGQSAYANGRAFAAGDVVESRVVAGLTVNVSTMFVEAEAQAD